MPSRGLDLKPRTIGELLDASFLVYRHRFWRLLIACTLVSLPTLILAALYAQEATDAVANYLDWVWTNAQRGSKPPPADFFEDYIFDVLAPLQAVAWVQAGMQAVSRGGAFAVMAVATWYVVRRQEIPTAKALLLECLPRVPAIIVANFALSQLVGLALCCPPLGIILFVLVLPAPAVMMLERGRLETAVRGHMETASGIGRGLLRFVVVPITIGLDGLVRSLTLSFHAPTIGRGTLYAFFQFLFLSFFVMGTTLGIQGLSQLIGIESNAALFWAQHYAEVAILPVTGIGLTLWYLDVRARREGLDLIPLVAKSKAA